MKYKIILPRLLISIFIIALSTLVGFFLGGLSTFLYHFKNSPPISSETTGGILGAITGSVYMGLIFILYNPNLSRSNFKKKSILIGILAGILCSTALHMYLLKTTQSNHFGPILIGALFAIPPSLILSWIAACFVWFAEKSLTKYVPSNTENNKVIIKDLAPIL